jgi:hypothetical protein
MIKNNERKLKMKILKLLMISMLILTVTFAHQFEGHPGQPRSHGNPIMPLVIGVSAVGITYAIVKKNKNSHNINIPRYDAEMLEMDIESLLSLQKKTILTDNEFEKKRKELVKRLGKPLPENILLADKQEIYLQLEKLSAMKKDGVINEKEFNKNKRKLMKLI